jgi:hypothetical protein
MKRAGYLIEKIADTRNICLAYHKARRGKAADTGVLNFERHIDKNIEQLRLQILSGNVSVGNYHYFTIYDPKIRLICAADFRERVLHHALMNVCHPYFERNLIYDTYATRINKGIYAALDRAKKAMLNYRYAAKLDFRKYFDNISHPVLKAKLQQMFKDRTLLDVFGKIIDSYQTADGLGLPIGNLTSQYFANFYLSELDHYAKEVLRIPVYIRYMDDILLFENDKPVLKSYLSDLNAAASEKLGLTFKPFSIVQQRQGIAFLGYKMYRHRHLLSNSSKKRLKHKIRLYGKRLRENRWSETVYLNHIIPLLAFARHGYTKRLRQNCLISLKTSIW